MTLVYLTLAWTAGILLGRWLSPPLWVPGSLALLSLAALVRLRRQPSARLAAALVLAAALGAGRMALALPQFDAGDLASHNDLGRAVVVRGTISSAPDRRSTYTQLELAADQLQDGEAVYPVHGRLVLNVASYPVHQYGDRLLAEGRLETPPVLDDFDYREYLAGRGVHSVLRRPQVTALGERGGSALLRWLYGVRERLRAAIERSLPNPEAGLLAGILLGLGHTLPAELDEAFRAAGLSHIMVISGYNVGLVSVAILLVARKRLHYWLALGLSVAAIAVYTLFVGPSAPVVRAALMAGLLAGAQWAGRKSHALTSLAATSLIMTAANPLMLWSASYQLSFAATLGLVLLEPALSRRLQARLARTGDLQRAAHWSELARDVLLVTLSAQLATLPVIWTQFGRLSLVALPANALVLPAQPPIMLLGAIATALGALWAPLGQAAGWLVWPLLRYCVLVVEWLGGLPLASVAVPRLSPALVWGAYALAATWLVWKRPRKVRLPAVHELPVEVRRGRASLVGLTLAVVLVWSAVGALPDRRLHVYVLDVGQGDAILLRTPGGRTVLVDGGPDPVLLTARLGRILPFWQRRIDVLIATHADQDHLAGLLTLFERYRVGQIVEPAVLGESALRDEWDARVVASGVPVSRLGRGAEIALGDDLRLRVLNPFTASADGDDNGASLVLLASLGRWRMLLTGDMDAETEAGLIAAGEPPQAAFLKVAHHGARTATSDAFLAAVQPQVALISVGAENDYGHPTEETLARLAAEDVRVYRTDQDGTIELITDGTQCWITCTRPAAR
jgi:competence protein ComEC